MSAMFQAMRSSVFKISDEAQGESQQEQRQEQRQMSAYIQELTAAVERKNAEQQKLRDEEARANAQAARERLVPLEQRVARLLATIPPQVQHEGLSLAVLQASLRGRWRGTCHPGELGDALRKLNFERRRRWHGAGGFQALWFPIQKGDAK
jgi:predicted DNA binding CopG/RHH family protein